MSLTGIILIPLFILSLYLSVILFARDEPVSGILNHPSFSIELLSGLIVARIGAVLIDRRKKVKQLQYLQEMNAELCDLDR